MDCGYVNKQARVCGKAATWIGTFGVVWGSGRIGLCSVHSGVARRNAWSSPATIGLVSLSKLVACQGCAELTGNRELCDPCQAHVTLCRREAKALGYAHFVGDGCGRPAEIGRARLAAEEVKNTEEVKVHTNTDGCPAGAHDTPVAGEQYTITGPDSIWAARKNRTLTDSKGRRVTR